jgi:phosphoribosylamine---glycine ligase
MKILVVGSGGREHALVWALRRTASTPVQIFCAPGNAGIAQIAECVPIRVDEIVRLAEFTEQSQIDLTMIGPEAPLAAGIVDEFQSRRLRVVGPGREAARLESSKAFAKDFMARHRIPTARYRVSLSANEAREILERGEFGGEDNPVVLKADGLAAGKGVIVAPSRAAGIEAVRDLAKTVSADAIERIVIEEALAGREVSLLLFTDGKDFRLMPASRDHKRVGEGDTGPNTGGMGAITDGGLLNQSMTDRIVREIVEPTLQGAADEGFPVRGVLFLGLMMTVDGPRVLEYNVRFGDPETQAIMVRLRTDISQIFQAITEQTLGKLELDWSGDSSACVVLAAAGYPGKVESGSAINGLELAEKRRDVTVFHSATARSSDGSWLTSGGRVLGVTGTGADLNVALSHCYQAIADIGWEGMHYRRDIGRPPSSKTSATA